MIATDSASLADDASPAAEPSILEHPHVAFGREIAGDLEAGLRREWLVTNGLGGYASATVAGVLTRSYHGLLVAALEPPVARTVLVAGSVDWATYDGARYPLSTARVRRRHDPAGRISLSRIVSAGRYASGLDLRRRRRR